MQTLILTGDVNLRNVTDPSVPFALVADALGEADILFGNLEGCLYDATEEVPYKRGWFHAGTGGAPALQAGGFHGVGCANNVTFGHEAIVATLARLDEMGIPHCGAGTSRSEARAPVVLERDGTRYGFLQYTSVFWPIGHEAGDETTGVAAMKAHTTYQPNVRIPEIARRAANGRHVARRGLSQGVRGRHRRAAEPGGRAGGLVPLGHIGQRLYGRLPGGPGPRGHRRGRRPGDGPRPSCDTGRRGVQRAGGLLQPGQFPLRLGGGGAGLGGD